MPRCRVSRVNASLASTYQPYVVGEIVSLGKVAMAASAVASRVEGPAAPSAWHGQCQRAGNVSSVPICDRDRTGLPPWRWVRTGSEQGIGICGYGDCRGSDERAFAVTGSR